MASSFMAEMMLRQSSNLAIRFHEALEYFVGIIAALTGHNDIEGL